MVGVSDPRPPTLPKDREQDADWTESSPDDRPEDACTCLIIDGERRLCNDVVLSSVGGSVLLHCLLRN